LHLLALARKGGGSRTGVGFVPNRDEYQIASDSKGPSTA
jgi:6,7-dimethyl-8-ribityllumazine synthase